MPPTAPTGSEPATGQPVTTPSTGATPAGDPPAAPDLNAPLGAPGLAALQAERAEKTRLASELAAATARLAEIDQASMSEAQRLQAALATAEERAATAERERLRLTVATTYGIGTDDLVLLTGSDEATLNAQAERIKALNATSTPSVPAFAPNPGQGHRQAVPASGREAGLAEAQRRFGTKTA